MSQMQQQEPTLQNKKLRTWQELQRGSQHTTETSTLQVHRQERQRLLQKKDHKEGPPFGPLRHLETTDSLLEVMSVTDCGDRIPELERKLRDFFAYIASFTSGECKQSRFETVVTVTESKHGAHFTLNTIELHALEE